MKHKIIYLYRDELQIVKGLKAKILISRKYMNKNKFFDSQNHSWVNKTPVYQRWIKLFTWSAFIFIRKMTTQGEEKMGKITRALGKITRALNVGVSANRANKTREKKQRDGDSSYCGWTWKQNTNKAIHKVMPPQVVRITSDRHQTPRSSHILCPCYLR